VEKESYCLGFLGFLKKLVIAFGFALLGFILILFAIAILIAPLTPTGYFQFAKYQDLYIVFVILAVILFFLGIALMFYGRKISPIR